MADMRVSVVKAACAHVLGLGVVESMEGSQVPLPTIMSIAAQRAFCFDETSEAVDTLRAALRALQYEGQYLIRD